MIDEEWLSTLRFVAVQNVQVTGLVAIGSQKIVLKGEMPDGKHMVLKVPKTSIGFHLREIPPGISLKPEYELNQVNKKLSALVGNPLLDKMSRVYDDLYCKILYIISESGVPGLIFSNLSPDSVETIPFLLHTPALRRRLEEFAEWPFDPDDPLTMIPSVNGDRHPIRLTILPDIRNPWINEAIEGLDGLPEYNRELAAKSLHGNPLIVWGAAALEGFFTDDEMPKVADFLKKTYGSFVDRPDVLTVMGQAEAILNLVAQYSIEAKVERFVRLCACCGLVLQIADSDGKIVADGLKMLG